eukprot:g649.t1
MKSRSLVIDNGADTMKIGFAGEDMSTPRGVIPNRFGTLPKQITKLYGEDTVKIMKNKATLRYKIPFERGYMIDPDCQEEIWSDTFSKRKLNIDPKQCNLLLTEPYLNPRPLREQTNELVFEKFQFQSAAYRTPAELTSLDLAFDPTRKGSSHCVLVLDLGFSFTHAVPVYKHRPIRDAIRRVSVGGKLLTNYLKELVSYRAYNMMEDTYLMNRIKQELCFVSSDIMNDLRKSSEANKRLRREYVLPDFVNSMDGYVRPLNTAPKVGEQTLVLQNERVAVPEVLFHPTDIGMKEGGVVDAVIQAVESSPEYLRPSLYANIVITGGSSKFKGLIDRVKTELRSRVPHDIELNVTTARGDSALSAWRGGIQWASSSSDDLPTKFVTDFHDGDVLITKQKYEEAGHDAMLRLG